jgi:hypothetical protein
MGNLGRQSTYTLAVITIRKPSHQDSSSSLSLSSLFRFESKLIATHFVLQRALSGADAINALRPFYFAVHPDFFGQYPRERVS